VRARRRAASSLITERPAAMAAAVGKAPMASMPSTPVKAAPPGGRRRGAAPGPPVAVPVVRGGGVHGRPERALQLRQRAARGRVGREPRRSRDAGGAPRSARRSGPPASSASDGAEWSEPPAAAAAGSSGVVPCSSSSSSARGRAASHHHLLPQFGRKGARDDRAWRCSRDRRLVGAEQASNKVGRSPSVEGAAAARGRRGAAGQERRGGGSVSRRATTRRARSPGLRWSGWVPSPPPHSSPAHPVAKQKCLHLRQRSLLSKLKVPAMSIELLIFKAPASRGHNDASTPRFHGRSCGQGRNVEFFWICKMTCQSEATLLSPANARAVSASTGARQLLPRSRAARQPVDAHNR
jgi:hypothetical protein